MVQTERPADNLDDTVMSPELAAEKLRNLGYSDPALIEQMVREGLGSHYTRALGVIAGGAEVQDINELYHQLYPGEKRSATPADVEAARAADEAAAEGAWERFMDQRAG